MTQMELLRIPYIRFFIITSKLQYHASLSNYFLTCFYNVCLLKHYFLLSVVTLQKEVLACQLYNIRIVLHRLSKLVVAP